MSVLFGEQLVFILTRLRGVHSESMVCAASDQRSVIDVATEDLSIVGRLEGDVLEISFSDVLNGYLIHLLIII